ncbi:MAG: hypothetical protein AB7I18_11380 [Candidatus Berkiella sp.]
MNSIKNTLSAALTSSGLSFVFGVSTPWTLIAVASTSAVVHWMPEIVKKGSELKKQATDFYQKHKPKAKALAKEAAWACSPTNPDQNVIVGGSLGFAASNVIATLAELEGGTYAMAVSGATVGLAVAGHYLPSDTLSQKCTEAWQKMTQPVPLGKTAPTPAGTTPAEASDQSPKRSKVLGKTTKK